MDRSAPRPTGRAAVGALGLMLLALPTWGQLAPATLPESLDSSNTSHALAPALASDPRNETFSVWHRLGAGGELQLVGRGFEAFGNAAGATSLIDNNVSPQGYDVAALTSTTFLVVWVGPQGTTQPSIFGARYSVFGARQGETFVINPPSPATLPHRPSVDCRPGRGCFVAWSIDTVPSGAAGSGTVMGRRFDDNLHPLGDAFVINQTPAEAPTEPKVAMSPGGRVVVAWPQQRVVFEGPPPPTSEVIGTPTLRFYGTDGQALSNEILLEAAAPQIDTDGLDVAWNDHNQVLAMWDRSGETDAPGIYGQLVNEVGVPLGERRRLNRETSILRSKPALDWSDDLRWFAASWSGVRTVGSDLRREITLLFLDSAGAPVGHELPAVQSLRLEDLSEPAVAAPSGFGSWVAFSDAPTPQSGRARIVQFSDNPVPCYSPFPLPFPVGPCTLIGANSSNLLAMGLFRGEDGRTAPALPVNLTNDTAAFFFQSARNPEVFLKTVDGSGLNHRQWLFYGALSNQEYVLSIFDGNNRTRVYYNPAGALASVGDTDAFLGGPPTALEQANSPSGVASELLPRGTCLTDGTSLCVLGGQFRIEVEWRDFEGRAGVGTAEQLTSESGHFWFFYPQNIELVVKVLDGRPVNGHFWLFYASLSNVGFTVRVFDGSGQLLKTYTNPPGTFASVADTDSL